MGPCSSSRTCIEAALGRCWRRHLWSMARRCSHTLKRSAQNRAQPQNGTAAFLLVSFRLSRKLEMCHNTDSDPKRCGFPFGVPFNKPEKGQPRDTHTQTGIQIGRNTCLVKQVCLHKFPDVGHLQNLPSWQDLLNQKVKT